MRIIISPAKKMRCDLDTFTHEDLPPFMPETEKLLGYLRSLTYDEAKELWQCSDAIARKNFEHLQSVNLKSNLTPALFSYDGIQFKYMAPHIFNEKELDYVRGHLRIISGFYGIVRPFDGVISYRLEMQARINFGEYRSLYHFWGARLAQNLCHESRMIVNLASEEYSKCILALLPLHTKAVTCKFAELGKNKEVIEKGTNVKMARGEMVRFMAENQITDFAGLKEFNRLNYTFSPKLSNETEYVFIKEMS